MNGRSATFLHHGHEEDGGTPSFSGGTMRIPLQDCLGKSHRAGRMIRNLLLLYLRKWTPSRRCSSGAVLAPYATAWWNSKLILAGHGAPFQPLRELGLRCRADLVIYGHTHVSSIVREEGTIFLNPGSAALPKGRDPASAAVLDRSGIRIFVLENGETLHHEPWI